MKICKTSILLLVTILFLTQTTHGQIHRIDPTNWWVGMKNPNVQLMVHGQNIALYDMSMKKYNGVKVKAVQKVENPNYLFIDLEISSKARAGMLQFYFSKDGQTLYQTYELQARKTEQMLPLHTADLIYLILPDRFSNGDTSNDQYADMADTEADRSNPWLRHGGDLQGIINHLDYVAELGVTAIWLNPVIENDQPQTNEGGTMRSAYHGYGFTDHYNVDRRLGGNKAYAEFVKKAHEKGLKVIQDAVYNHVGINHYFLRDMPMKSWLNQWPSYTNTSYKEQAALDPHAAQYDKLRMTDGWFMPFLPDLNQRNPLVANYLIQHAIWTVEKFNIDAYRIDTYMYNDMDFMNSCNAALKAEYPDIFLFGESLANPVPNQAAFVRNNMHINFECNLESTVDYQTHKAILTALNENYGWNEGVNRVYQGLVQDYLYQNPEKLVTYLDNHDENRFFSVVGEDLAKFKIGLSWLMTMRGIPEIYYGTEILTKNFKNPTDAEVRKDFPGGFPGDQVNKFTKEGRTETEQETFEFVQKLAKIRKEYKAIGFGEFTQFAPFDDGIYVYFRHTTDEQVMVITNMTDKAKKLDMSRFDELLKGKRKAQDLLKNSNIGDLNTEEFAAKTVTILKIND